MPFLQRCSGTPWDLPNSTATPSPNRSRTSERGRPVRPSVHPSVRPSHRSPSRPVPSQQGARSARTAPHSPAALRALPGGRSAVRCPPPKGALRFDCGYGSARGGMRAGRKGHGEGAAATNSTGRQRKSFPKGPGPNLSPSLHTPEPQNTNHNPKGPRGP